jgi:hypothetical protein
MSAEEILVIILSSFLALFLLLGIVAAVMIIKLIKTVQSIANKTEEAAGNVVAASETLRGAAGPMAMLRMFANVTNMFTKHSKGK